MKPIFTSTIEDRLDGRERNRRFGPFTDYFYQPRRTSLRDGGSTHGRDMARRAFRRMTAKMSANHNRIEPSELIVFCLVALVVAWPLLSLLFVLFDTPAGWWG